MKIIVAIPARNEEKYIENTLLSVGKARSEGLKRIKAPYRQNISSPKSVWEPGYLKSDNDD